MLEMEEGHYFVFHGVTVIRQGKQNINGIIVNGHLGVCYDRGTQASSF